MPKETHAAPELAVINWLNRQDANRIGVARLSIAAISYALDCLADMQRKSLLTDRFQQFLHRGFARILAASSSSPLRPAAAHGLVGGSGSGSMEAASRQGSRRDIRALGADERA